jgi:C4-dicarboxylate-specific signal transduction histidine kinase
MFFLSLLNAATIVDEGNLGPDSISLIASYDAALQSVNQELQTLPSDSDLLAQIAEMQKQIDALQAQPIFDIAIISASINALSTAPVTVTADFTVGSSSWYINNKSGSTCVATLPTPSSYVGRQITIKNMQAQLVNSASSNVVPIGSTTAGTAILLAVVGNWATMVSDGTNWVIMQQAANNCLLLE